jgi:hypothetical protein
MITCNRALVVRIVSTHAIIAIIDSHTQRSHLKHAVSMRHMRQASVYGDVAEPFPPAYEAKVESQHPARKGTGRRDT